MKILRQLPVTALVIATAILLSSCKSKEIVIIGVTKDVEHFPKIKEYDVEFDCISPKRTFSIKEPASLTFRLTNISQKNLVIYEWKMLDDYNVKTFIAPWKEGTPLPADDKFICIAPEIKKPVRRMTLELTQNTSTIVNKTIDFKKDVIKKDIDKPQTFIVYGELYLESLPLKSRAETITITP